MLKEAIVVPSLYPHPHGNGQVAIGAFEDMTDGHLDYPVAQMTPP
jgi:hypothetical protein